MHLTVRMLYSQCHALSVKNQVSLSVFTHVDNFLTALYHLYIVISPQQTRYKLTIIELTLFICLLSSHRSRKLKNKYGDSTM